MQAFQELQTKMVSTTQQLKIADFQIEQLKRQIVHAKLVEKEIGSLPKDVRTYEGVGRMQVFTQFLLMCGPYNCWKLALVQYLILLILHHCFCKRMLKCVLNNNDKNIACVGSTLYTQCTWTRSITITKKWIFIGNSLSAFVAGCFMHFAASSH